MTHPRRYLVRMAGFVVAVAVLASALIGGVMDAFRANPGLNGLILGILLFGIAYIFRTVAVLLPEVRWLAAFRARRWPLPEPRMLAPMAAMLGEDSDRLSLTPTAMRSLLDGIAARLDESRDISRYLIGLLIFLGLLGTFWGLLQTVEGVSGVIGGLSMDAGNIDRMFAELQRGLREPLAGMGTAFSSSLFGLAGSLVLGFLELQAGQAQNRFFNDLEDWLSGQARLAPEAPGGTAAEGAASPVYVQALLEQTAEALGGLQRTLQRGEEARVAANSGLADLAEKIAALTERLEGSRPAMLQLARGQADLKPILSRIDQRLAQASAGEQTNEKIRQHVRSIDAHLGRLLADAAQGRSEMTEELRAEFRILSRTLAAMADGTKDRDG